MSSTVTLPSPAKGLNALLGLPTPSAESLPAGAHASVPQIGRSIAELGDRSKQLGESSESGEKEAGADNIDSSAQEDAANQVMEGGEAVTGTEEIEIAEVVDEESGQNEMMIITETRADNQVIWATESTN